MLFTMWLNLYATRLVLRYLGIEDMGVYGVVGSIVSLFTVFSGGVTIAVQRFITYELGVENGQPNKVFCTSLNVIFVLSVVMILMLEAGGLWMLYNKVNFPPQSLDAAFWVFQFSVLTCVVNMISIPYNALIIAHEKMGAFAAISIIQTVLNFMAAYSLTYLSANRLLIYAAMLAAAGIVVRFLYQLYCHRNFDEARYHWGIDGKLMRRMGSFTGVSTTSGMLQIVSSQGIVFVINLTFGVAVNAVYAITNGQLRNAVLSFALNILKAIAPQITKTYAEGDISHHLKLVYGGSKMQVYFIYFLMIPFLVRTRQIMALWLGEVPEHTVVFARCIIFISLTYAAFETIRASVYATGRIKQFMLIPETAYIMVLPVSYVVARLTDSPDCLIGSVVAVEILICCVRVYYATKVTPITVRALLRDVLLPCAMVAIGGCLFCYYISAILPQNLLGLMALLLVSAVALIVLIYMIGVSKQERAVINKAFQTVVLRRGAS